MAMKLLINVFWPRMARIEMDCNFKTLGERFKFIQYVLEKFSHRKLIMVCSP